tara:strand:+ start:2423 stop:6214 length:3792 start_codon:yes stop_codon:yes gene_type:complete
MLISRLKKYAVPFVSALAFVALPAFGQVVYTEDFGSGTYPGAPLPPGVTTYTYKAPTTGVFPDSLDDGQYVIAENIRRAFSNWVDLNDHTSNDGTGYALVVNATLGSNDEFYRTTVDLAANQDYEFSAWVVNANTQVVKDYCDQNGGFILPNVTFSIQDMTGTVLASRTTGNIPISSPPTWEEYILEFSTGASTTQVQLVLIDNAPGGCGNDLAIDDIMFRTKVTMAASDDAGTVNDSSVAVSNLLNVLTNDTDDGAPVSGFDLSLATGSSLPAALTFDTVTGEVGVQAGTADGVYSFNYELCAQGSAFNCDIATVTVTVSNPVVEPTPAPTGVQSCTALSGFWTGSGTNWSTTTSSGLGVSLEHTVELGGTINAFQGNLNNIGAFSEVTAQGNSSLETMFYWDTSPEFGTQSEIDSVTGTLTLTFDRPVYNPVVHLDKLGELNGSVTNSVYLELITPGASITRLSGTTHFVTDTNAVYREIDQTSSGSESSLVPLLGTAAGSILIEGVHSSLTFRMSGLGLEGSGYDQFELAMCGHSADFGDAPGNYKTLKANNGAIHQITGATSDLFIGTAPDSEADGSFASGNATDDSDDGVSLPAFFQNVAVDIPVAVVGAGYLQAWIDWDGDGSFAGTGEQVATDVVDGGAGDADAIVNGTITLSVIPPQGSTTSQTFARFRWSSAQALGSEGFVSDGEVEDYALTVTASTTYNCATGSSATGSGYASSGTGAFKDAIWWFDWSCAGATFGFGDIVNKSWSMPGGITVTAQVTDISQTIEPYATGSSAGDALDDLYGGVNPIGLANAISAEDPNFNISWSATFNGQPIPVDLILADAEDLGGAEATQATTDGTKWEPIEYSGEVYAAFTLDGATVIESEPPNAGSGTLLVMSENVSNLNIDLLSEGKTAVAFGFFLPMDIGDAPATYGPGGGHYARHTAVSSTIQPAAVTLADSLTYSSLTPNATVYMGIEKPDSDPSTLAGVDATGDDTDKIDDEDGVTLPMISAGAIFELPVTVEGAGGYLQVWSDWNADGDFNDAGEQVAIDAQDNVTGVSGRTDDTDTTAGLITLSVLAPSNMAVGGTSYIRLRWSTEQGLGLTSPAADGEVEDYAFLIMAANAELTGAKAIEVYDPAGTGDVYSMPGTDVLYTLTVSNTGNGPADADTVVLIDRMPAEVEFFNADIDTGGPDRYPGSDPVGFIDSASGLTYTYATDTGYSNLSTPPGSFGECSYIPQNGYDPAVTYICFNPKGSMATGDPDPEFSLSFRARIK